MIPALNCLTSFFAGFVIFAYMGYLSKVTGQDIGNIVQAGQGLAFVVYPYAGKWIKFNWLLNDKVVKFAFYLVTTIAGAPFWSIMFFFMLILLGIDSSVSSCSNLISYIK